MGIYLSLDVLIYALVVNIIGQITFYKATGKPADWFWSALMGAGWAALYPLYQALV
jgi:hypothetical protein